MKSRLSINKAKMNDYELEKHYHLENFLPDYKLENDAFDAEEIEE